MFFGNNKELENKLSESQEALVEANETLNDVQNENTQLKSQLEDQINENQSLQFKIQQLEKQLAQKEETVSVQNNDVEEYLQKLFHNENKHLKSSLLDIQGNIASSTEMSRESLSTSYEIKQIYSEASGDLDYIVSNISGLDSHAKEVNEVVTQLDEKAKNITEAVSMIHNIVLQINILSLNAAVEAATAGEAGKGFAVVAQEVKNLANKTAEAAKNIEEVTSTIQESVIQTNDKFNAISDVIEQIAQKTDSYSTGIASVMDKSNDSFNKLAGITDRVFMSLAKLDHVIWKVNTYLTVAQKEPAFEFVNHKNCRLGKWYNEGLGKRYFSATPSYSKLDLPHSKVHNATHKVFDAVDHHTVQYTDAIDALEEMEQASYEVFNLLDTILHERG